MAAERLVVIQLELLSVGDTQLELDEVEAGNRLGNRMLDLDARVELEEVDLLAGDEELGRAGAAVADRPGERHGGIVESGPKILRQARRRRLLDDLLVAPLHGAVALSEREHRPVGVGQKLYLDVTWPFQVALEEDGVVPERRFGLATGGCKCLVEFVRATGRRACRARRPRQPP